MFFIFHRKLKDYKDETAAALVQLMPNSDSL